VISLVRPSGSNSAVECQLPKLDVAGSIPVSRSIVFNTLPGIARSYNSYNKHLTYWKLRWLEHQFPCFLLQTSSGLRGVIRQTAGRDVRSSHAGQKF
jgi:hypothetical protein